MIQSLRNCKLLAVGAAIAGLAAFASPAAAEFHEGAWELRLDGFATNDVDFDNSMGNVGVALGYFLTDQFEVGLRQDVSFSDFGSSIWNGATAVFINYHFGDVGAELQPFIGASLGYIYGDTTHETFVAGPEGGINYFFGEDWFIFGQIEYQFLFDDASDADDQFSDGVFNYRLGIGVTL